MGLKNPKRAGHFLFFFQTGRKLKSKHFPRLRTTVRLYEK